MIELSLAQNRGENSKDSPISVWHSKKVKHPYSRFLCGYCPALSAKEHPWGLTSQGLVTLTGPALAHLKRGGRKSRWVFCCRRKGRNPSGVTCSSLCTSNGSAAGARDRGPLLPINWMSLMLCRGGRTPP